MWISKQEGLGSQEAQQHPVETNGTIQWSTPWHSTLATGTETFCSSSPAFLGLPLSYHFYAPAGPLTKKKLSPPGRLSCFWRGMASVTLEEAMGKLASAWWSGEQAGHGQRVGRASQLAPDSSHLSCA